MNPGGEPERDDTGLPPVNIEIPDDARDLDRDLQAYYREVRAQRRRERRLRMHGTLARDSIVLPLLACCLILALITGTLLTIFTATSDQNVPGVPGYGKAPAHGRSPATSPTRPPGKASPAPGSSSSPRSGSPSPGRSSSRPGSGSPAASASTRGHPVSAALAARSMRVTPPVSGLTVLLIGAAGPPAQTAD